MLCKWRLKTTIRVITLCRTAPFLPKSESLEWSQLKHLVKKCQEVEPKDMSNLWNMLLLHHVTMLYPPQDSVTIKVIQKAGNTLQLTKNLSWVGIGRQLSKQIGYFMLFSGSNCEFLEGKGFWVAEYMVHTPVLCIFKPNRSSCVLTRYMLLVLLARNQSLVGKVKSGLSKSWGANVDQLKQCVYVFLFPTRESRVWPVPSRKIHGDWTC